jgi:hypothetical protein
MDTVPEVSFRPERVNPATQAENPSIRQWRSLIMQAIAEGWQTPEENKQRVIKKILDRIESEGITDHDLIAAVRTLWMLDRDEWERRHPDLAGQTKGSVQMANTQRVISGTETVALLQQFERATGTKIASPAMLEVELAADAVLPPEIVG